MRIVDDDEIERELERRVPDERAVGIDTRDELVWNIDAQFRRRRA
jgi:hypothetical protein